MNYTRTKVTVMQTPVGVLMIGAILYSDVMKATLEEFLFYSMIAILFGTILGILFWGLGRILYCESYINKNVYTPGKLKMLWGFSKQIELSKRMSLDELIEAINKFTNRWLPVVALDEEETIKFARAAILLRYQNQWERKPKYPYKDIEKYIDKCTTEMKVLDFFKGGD